MDPDPARMPVRDVFEFNRAIIDATQDLVCAYKPNVGFYEGLGEEGQRALRRTLDHIPGRIPVIGDCKRGDVQPTAASYARAVFDGWGFDAVTVNPYGGRDTVQPFTDYSDRGVFVWCRSSNPGARELQDLIAADPVSGDAHPLYEWVAMRAAAWNASGNVGLVVGATYPEELRRVRELCPDMPILVPGDRRPAGRARAVGRLRRRRVRGERGLQRLSGRAVRLQRPGGVRQGRTSRGAGHQGPHQRSAHKPQVTGRALP